MLSSLWSSTLVGDSRALRSRYPALINFIYGSVPDKPTTRPPSDWVSRAFPKGYQETDRHEAGSIFILPCRS